MNTFLADAINIGGGTGLIHTVFVVLIIAVCLGCVWWLGQWLFSKMGVPAIVLTVWMAFFIIIGVIVVINFLLSLIGHGFIAW